MKTSKTITLSALAFAVSLAFASGNVAAQAMPPLGPPCIVASNFEGTFEQGDGGGQPATLINAGVAIGCGSVSQDFSFAGGPWSTARFSSVAIGANALAELSAVAVGNSAHAVNAGVAVGELANANDFGVALGLRADATNGGVAIGAAAIADEPGTVSFGSGDAFTPFGPSSRRLVNVAAGIAASDAATIGQLSPFASALGGGSLFSSGVFTPPSYVFLSGSSFADVGSALADLDGRVTGLEAGGTGTPVPGPQGPPGPAGADGAADPLAVRYDDESRATATLSGENGTRIGNVADAVAGTDAVTLRQMRNADALLSTRIDTLGDRLTTVETRIGTLSRRVAKVGALGAATGLMAAASGGNTDQWRMGAAVANFDGEDALSVGLTGGWRLKNGRPIGFVFGGSTAGGDAAVGLGFSVGLGHR